MVAAVNQQLATTVFKEDLATPATRGQGLAVAGHDADGHEVATPESNKVARQRTLRAQGQSKTGVFHVRTFNEETIRRDGGGAHVHVGVRGVGTLGSGAGPATKFRPRFV